VARAKQCVINYTLQNEFADYFEFCMVVDAAFLREGMLLNPCPNVENAPILSFLIGVSVR
jgi:hypothetical protein